MCCTGKVGVYQRLRDKAAEAAARLARRARRSCCMMAPLCQWQSAYRPRAEQSAEGYGRALTMMGHEARYIRVGLSRSAHRDGRSRPIAPKAGIRTRLTLSISVRNAAALPKAG